MDQGPLVSEEIAVGERVIEEFDKVMPVQAAFWLRFSDENQRYLYLVADGVASGTKAAYLELYRIWKELDDPYFDFLRVTLLAPTEPLAVAALQRQQQTPRKKGYREGSGKFGGYSIEDLYFYPPLNHVTT